MAARARPWRKAAKAARPPAAGRAGQSLPVDLPPETVAALDQWAGRAGLSRSEAIRRLLEIALRRFEDYAPVEGPD